MKKLEFKTSKGEFILIDIDSLNREYKEQYFCNYINNFKGLCIDDVLYEEVSCVAEITEEQSINVVDVFIDGMYLDYEFKCGTSSFKVSLSTLLKSKGVDNTWVNPCLFKQIK